MNSCDKPRERADGKGFNTEGTERGTEGGEKKGGGKKITLRRGGLRFAEKRNRDGEEQDLTRRGGGTEGAEFQEHSQKWLCQVSGWRRQSR